LRQIDQARSDFALIESNLEFIAGQLARLPTRRDLAKAALGIIISTAALAIAGHPLGRNVLAPVMRGTAPGAEHYREIAANLRETARSCQFAGARREILHLAARFDSRADHVDRRAGSMTATRSV